MCGLCGIVDHSRSLAELATAVERMRARLSHRGPDDRGSLVDQGVALGHARLSIIDLAGGHQPQFNEDETCGVVFNGEIYNHRQLRRQLASRGHSFRSDSDTEVLVHLWEEFGERCVEHLRGMFAFVIHDWRTGTVFGARDHFGQKPLYYWNDGPKLAFASEIKALLELPDIEARLDPRGLDEFLFYQFVPHPRTLFNGIRQLPPAHWFRFHQGRLQVERYWEHQPAAAATDPTLNADSLDDQVESVLRESVAAHLLADVPVGVFLSGGIDSSLIAALAADEATQPLETFSIGFDDVHYDESEYAATVARQLGARHHAFRFEPTDLITQLTAVADVFDQPIADKAALPLLQLSRATARHVKVVLSGDGGDELFAGYRKYQTAVIRGPHFLERLDRTFPTVFASSRLARCGTDRLGLRRLRSRVAHRCLPESASSYWKGFWEGWNRQQLYRPELLEQIGGEFEGLSRHKAADDGLDRVHRMLQLDCQGYLPDNLLLKTDTCTMAFGLESRAPFLDRSVAELAARLPLEWKTTRQESKVALRRLARRLLPLEITERPKRGFGVPLKAWFRGPLATWLEDTLLHSSRTAREWFRPQTIERLLREHRSGRRNHASRLYSLLVFELWSRRYLPS